MRDETHRLQSGFVRSTSEMPRAYLPSPRAEFRSQWISQIADALADFLPSDCAYPPGMQLGAASDCLGTPQVGHDCLVRRHEAVDGRNCQGRSLLERTAENFVENVIHARVHRVLSIIAK